MNDESLARMNLLMLHFFKISLSSAGTSLKTANNSFFFFFPPELINVCSQDLDYCITSHRFARLKMSVELISCKST